MMKDGILMWSARSLIDRLRGTGEMTRSEKRLVQAAAGDADLAARFDTGTRVDVGSWFVKKRVRALLLPGTLLLLADGRRPYVEAVPFAVLRGSLYNHVTGEVVLAPAGDVRVRTLRLPPIEGKAIIDRIRKQET